MNINQLLKLFDALNKEQKQLLFNILLEILRLDDHEKKAELIEMMEDFKEDLLYCDENTNNEKIYLTQAELAKTFDIPEKTVQQIIEKNGVKPSKKWSKPYYDFDEFKEYYFQYKETRKKE